MKSESTRGIPSQVIIGLFVIGIGILFLLDNMDIIHFREAFAFWPSVFILIGVIKLLDSQTPNSRFVGAAFIAVGTLLVLNRLGIVNFSVRQLWPLVLIGAGALVVWKALASRRDMGKTTVSKDDDVTDSVVNITAVLGGFQRRVNSQNFLGGEITAVMGGCELDLRGASIQGEAVINVFAAMGGIELKVPTDWTVVLHGAPILGGFDEKTVSPPDGSKRLIVKGYAIMGGVEVRN